MGFIGDWVKARKMSDPVRGTLQVTASSYPPNDAMSANYNINGIVSGDGIVPTAVQHSGIARTKKWPQNGQVLPVTVDRADPTRIRIEWDEVEDSWKRAQDTAAEMAEWMRAGKANPDANGALSAAAASAAIPPQAMDILNKLGIDPSSANVQVMPGETVSFGMPQGAFGMTPQAHEEDPAERLRKLQELKAGGLITDEEYEAQRKRVIGDV